MTAYITCPGCGADLEDEVCVCPDDVFWARLLGDDDPCAPGKDWAAAAFGEVVERSSLGTPVAVAARANALEGEGCSDFVTLDLDDPYFDGQTLPDALSDYDHVHSTTGVCVKKAGGPR
jgi:hypothetical protein